MNRGPGGGRPGPAPGRWGGGFGGQLPPQKTKNVRKTVGQVTHFVHSAGIVGKNSKLADSTAENMRAVVDVNLMGALLCSRAAVNRILRSLLVAFEGNAGRMRPGGVRS